MKQKIAGVKVRSGLSMKRKLTPQEKKIQSYVHDGRNMYGESRTSAIKSIHRRKALVNRHFRRASTQQIRSTMDTNDTGEITEIVQAVARKQWKKVPDRPLVEYVENRWRRRRHYSMQSKRESSILMQEAKRRLRKQREITDFMELP